MMTMPGMNRMPGFPGQPMMSAQQFPGTMPQFAPPPQRNPGMAIFPGQPQGFAAVQPQQRQQPQQQQQQMAGERIAVPAAPPGQFVPKQVPSKPAADRLAALELPAPPPTFRLQSPDEPTPAAPARLTMPAPEQLGITTARAAMPTASEPAIDWNDVHARLRQMGTISFQLHKMQNGCRVTFVLAARGDGQPRYVETEGASEAEAVLAALQRAEGIASR